MNAQPVSESAPPSQPSSLGTAAERHALILAVVSAVLILDIGVLLGVVLRPTGGLSLVLVVISIGGAWLAWNRSLRKVRLRNKLLAAPFRVEWEAVLNRDVAFFRALPDKEKIRFRNELKVFLGEKMITGIRTTLDPQTRVLGGAAQ